MSGDERASEGALADAIAALRAQGAAQREPLRFGTVEALARRLSGAQGEARALLQDRLERALAQLRARLQDGVAPGPGKAPPPLPALAALSALVDRLGREGVDAMAATPAEPTALPAADAPARATRPASQRPGAVRDSASADPRATPRADGRGLLDPPRPLRAVTAFERTWARLRAERLLHAAQTRVPQRAGPLNGSRLTHRLLHALKALSPAYLEAFMAQMDTLMALEQTALGAEPLPQAAAAAAAAPAPAPVPRGGAAARSAPPEPKPPSGGPTRHKPRPRRASGPRVA